MRSLAAVIRAVAALALVAATACASLSTDTVPRVGGATIAMVLKPQPEAAVRGELVTVSNDSIWVLSGSRLSGAPISSVIRVQVRRHSMGAGTTALWGFIGAGVTSGGLTAACNSVSSGCGAVFAGTALAWAVVTLLSAIPNELSSWSASRIPPPRAWHPMPASRRAGRWG